VQSTLIDAGPLIALFDRDDKYHQKIVAFLKDQSPQLVSTWPVLTEVAHLLDFNVNAQLDFLRWVHRGGLDIHQLSVHNLERIGALTNAYRDRPMDLADASLIVTAEHRGIEEIISIDRDFDIYRTRNRTYVRNVFR
jgi:predicted nucleic acid-binding protein